MGVINELGVFDAWKLLEIVKEVRRLIEMIQKDQASKLGVNSATISSWENGGTTFLILARK